MPNKILVAYASRTGTTAGAAAAIGETLAENGADVDVCQMQDVINLAPYRAVIAGSAIQISAWLPEAIEFVQANQAALNQKPFAAFLVCMTMGMSSMFHGHVAEWLAPVRTLVPTVSEGLFAGTTIDVTHIPSFTGRLILRICTLFRILPQGDNRDWNKIRAWATALKPLLEA
jgi:menaquinone-dependent protoporphyrinogen oxidase